MFPVLFSFLMSLGLLIGVWLVLRRPMLWYCRTNEIVANQQRIIALLEKMAGEKPDDKKQVDSPEKE